MLKFLCKIALKLAGWKFENRTGQVVDRCVMLGMPHTSNWDFVLARICFYMLDIPIKFTIKDSWMKFPGMKAMGAIGIDRTPKDGSTERISMTQAMTNLFNENEKLVLIVTPEGTRKRNDKWKTGFYYIALNANVPIGLGFLDYKNKIAGFGKMIYPTGDFKKDISLINDFYKDANPRFPENFALYNFD